MASEGNTYFGSGNILRLSERALFRSSFRTHSSMTLTLQNSESLRWSFFCFSLCLDNSVALTHEPWVEGTEGY